MTQHEFKEAIERLEMSHGQAAGYLHVTHSAVWRWATGARPVPGPVAKALELALREQEDHR